jgi:hypothetical protein
MKTGTEGAFPSPLRFYVEHAARFADVVAGALRDLEASPLRDADDLTDAEVWLLGRDDEVRAVTRDVLDDWRRGLLDDDEASAVLHAYLQWVHDGLCGATRLVAPPACCILPAHAASAARASTDAEITRVAVLASRVFSACRPTPATVTSATGHHA